MALTDFRFEPGFQRQLTNWLADWNKSSSNQASIDVWSLGAYVEGASNCASMHAAGRAFDLTSLRVGKRVLVNARADQISTGNPAEQADGFRKYWSLIASLNLHFSYVLHHLYDNAHHDHIHIDNLVSGNSLSKFNPDSGVQNQSVQAICAHVWGRHDGPVTEEWSDTRRRVGPVLADLGLKNLGKQHTWHAFLRASVARG